MAGAGLAGWQLPRLCSCECQKQGERGAASLLPWWGAHLAAAAAGPQWAPAGRAGMAAAAGPRDGTRAPAARCRSSQTCRGVATLSRQVQGSCTTSSCRMVCSRRVKAVRAQRCCRPAAKDGTARAGCSETKQVLEAVFCASARSGACIPTASISAMQPALHMPPTGPS